MEQQEVKAPSFYRPSLGDESQKGLDHSVEEGLELATFDQCETVGDMDDSQLIGASEIVSVGNHDMVAGEVGGMVNVEENLAGKGVVEKRRRGRPPGSGRPPRGSVKTTVLLRKKKDEEDVCFICFDGGSLVLCDRRGCPKAYHPACIKRDDSFFRSKAKWNCGWHICNSCQKASYYMCYTCPYSWCKGCTKDADYQCIRGNKGLCGTCMRTVMLIENLQENKESVHVDFDDKSSWEYLFKVYWTFLKDKLSLTSDEVIRAKNPWKTAPVMGSNEESPCELYNTNNDKVVSISSNSYKDLGSINLKRQRINKKPIVPNTNSVSVEESDGQKVMPISRETTWASKELLEFVSHMKNGDMSVLSKFDVQGLLLDYIKKNNLRNPRQKCQIVCDSRFLNLFGKARLGHIEMLKLLESHFLTKEESLVDHTVRVGPVDAVCSQADSCWNHDNQTMMVNNKRRKMHKRVNEGASQPDPDAYAAIDVHNVNLIYLRRHLMENLMDDAEKFHDKVVGSIVRIKVSGSDQKQDIYRLVQVVGTSKVMEPYNVGTKTTDVMLEILNLDKKEVISIDGISNQEFSQDECERLRQSIKCGLIKCLTVREVQDKARALLAVKLLDGLESEVMLLYHLRDRASEKGHVKELRECVEKLQLLDSPEEHQRRLQEVPVVHSDPSMDPSSESEGIAREIDKKKQDDKDKMGSSGVSRKRREPISPRRRGGISIKDRGKTHKLLVTPSEQSRGKETFGRNGWNTTKNNDCPTGSLSIGWGNGAVVQSDISSVVTSDMSVPPLLSEINQSTNDMETDKMWHYKDPTGKVQGPFCMLQLRKWNMSGYFPPDLRIWRINEKQDSSVLLTGALTEEYSKEPLLAANCHLLSCDAKIASDGRDNCGQGVHGQRNNGTRVNPVDDKRFNGSRNHKQDEPSKRIDSGNEPPVNESPVNEQGSLSSICTAINNSGEGHVGVFSQGCDSLKDNNVSTSLLIPGKQDLSDQVGECQDSKRASTQNDGHINSHQNAKSPINNNHQDCENRSDSEGHSGQSSEHNWRDPCVSSSTCGLDSKLDFVSLSKPLETSELNQVVIDFSNVSCPTPKPSSVKLECQPADSKHLQSSNAPVHDAGVSWSTTSSIVAGPYLHEVAGEWGGFSSTSTKPSIEEWDSSLVSVSSLKPIEVASDCAATPASVNNELTHSSPSHRASHASSWQALVTEPGDFCSLFEESVSDLLAEVEAMETLHRTPSSPSIINYGGELTDSSRNDYLSSVKAFSPAVESGKGDALSSSGDVHLALQLTLTSEPLGAGKSDYLGSQKTVNGHSSSSGEIEGDTKHSDVSVNQLETGLDIQPAVLSSASWGMATTDTPWSARPESMDPNWRAVQASTHLSLVGSSQGNTIMSGSAPMQEKSSMNAGSSSGSILGSQTRNGNERIFNSRDRFLHGRDSSFGNGRHAWNRQPSFGGGNGFSQRSSKGQRICKYYAGGNCKKGSSCSFWHP